MIHERLHELNDRFAIDDQLKFELHSSGLVQGRINTEFCTGSFFLLGGHIAEFHPKSQKQPVLFMSEAAWFEVGKPIRGGIPICFPWFGTNKNDASLPAHGFVRTALWEVIESKLTSNGLAITLGYRVAPYRVTLTAVFGKVLGVTFSALNESVEEQVCEVALHTYFEVGDSRKSRVMGLERNEFRDQLTGEVQPPTGSPIRFTQETDRVYYASVPLVTIEDEANSRRVMIKPRNSLTTVVWNPWIAKSQRMPDFGDQEFERMCCVETANVAPNVWVVGAGQSQTIGFEISVT